MGSKSRSRFCFSILDALEEQFHIFRHPGFNHNGDVKGSDHLIEVWVLSDDRLK